jgi:N-hydroxyarylamine O-acetyltransferase
VRPLDPDLRDAYLDRLGLDAEPPSAEALVRLHRRHAERVPYETWWIHGGEGWSTDPHEAAVRVATQRRGGYCYHLNGALGLLLHSLGYRVARHAGGVHGPNGPASGDAGNHLVLTVPGLPSAENPGGEWHVDVGLGDALHEPLPLVAGSHRQGPFLLALTRPDDGAGDWHLAHDPSGGFRGMLWRTGDPDPDLLAERHAWLSTSPESGFVKLGLAQTRDATGVDVVHGLVPKRIGAGARTGDALTRRSEWFDALADLFGLTFEHSAPGTTDRLWERTVAAHRAWEAAGGV